MMTTQARTPSLKRRNSGPVLESLPELQVMSTPNNNKRMRSSSKSEMPMAPLPAKRLPCRSSYSKPLTANVFMPSSLDLDLHLEQPEESSSSSSRRSITRVPAAAARLQPRSSRPRQQQEQEKKSLGNGWEELLRLSSHKKTDTANKSSLSLDALLSLPTISTSSTTDKVANSTTKSSAGLKPSRSCHALCA